ncbi:hypothetical protein [Photobacterium atrarenae]|uniref:DUF4345 domain-containing protein n=1 Tax=Photobacterium atrarenae TaxID=865757 RepID=A0ABY5GK93_9GAMM|nr:hypothetical protein [Photobacterium atrarenae]UTV29534.1 hypothetical protein NNL38_21180 [Photobacterium atrarenae]
MVSQLNIGIALLLGLAALGNGVFMMIDPETWYWLVPGVPDRGPFNQHFLRDIGMIYMLIGVAFIWGAMYTQHRRVLWVMPTAWLASHAIFHFWEVWVGICGPEFLVIDFGGVTLPALLGIWLVYTCNKGQAHA